MDSGDGEGKASDRKDRKKQELRKAGIVTTRIRQQSRCTTIRRSEAEGQEQRGRSWATRGCRYRVGPGRSRRVSLGGSSRSQVAGPGKSVSKQAFCSEGSDGRHLSSWLLDLLLSFFFPAYVTSLGA